MQVSPSVSVALCTHNGARYLSAQIGSILAQSELPSQLVLSDDASTDDSVATVTEMVERFRAEHPAAVLELTVIENRAPLGVTKNFEQAIAACTGELVALCDQDDVWASNRIALATAQFAARPDLLLLHSNARLVDGDGVPIGYSLFEGIELTAAELAEIHAGNELSTLLRRNVVTGATTMFRRTLLDSAAPFPEPWVHDEWLAVIASILGTTDALSEQLIDYRQHGSNQIGARKRSLGGKLAELSGSRTERGAYLVARAEALVARLESLGALVPSTAIELATRKLEHERRRRDLPAFRLARLGAIVRESRSGEYRRFGRPRYDIARDLFQPGA
jgi:glycosyltransferase involved in cell wall biosynthesis